MRSAALARCAVRRTVASRRACSTLAARFSDLTDLADERLGAKVLFATDEWFATADLMLKPSAPHFDPETFCTQGKVMDGWESRRRRLPGHDWAIVRLGLAGNVLGLELDTAHFTGNQVPAASVYAACIDEDEASWIGAPRPTLNERGSCSTPEEIAEANARVEAAAEWHELLPITKLRAGYVADGYSVHRFAVPAAVAGRRVTHLRVNAHPDGGLARMRAWGVVSRDFARELAATAVGPIDLLSALNGARALGCSNRHYGEPRNLLRPGRGLRMDDGWETARNPNRPPVILKDEQSGLVHMPGVSDWCVLRLAAVGARLKELVIDTAHYRGNYPESVTVEACYAPDAPSAALLDDSDDGNARMGWRTLLPRTRLGPDAIHSFEGDVLAAEVASGRISHLRVRILPDGGIMRVRAFGDAVEAMPTGEVALDGGDGGGGGGGGGGGSGGSGGGGGTSAAGGSGGASASGSGGGGTTAAAAAAAASATAASATAASATASAPAALSSAGAEQALGWSALQARILSGGGTAEGVYAASRGYAFDEAELPHYHLQRGDTHAQFEAWAMEAAEAAEAAEVSGGAEMVRGRSHRGGEAAIAPGPAPRPPEWLTGAWARPLFSGGGTHTSGEVDRCHNLVSGGAFVDVRIPSTRDAMLRQCGRDRWDDVAAAVRADAPRPLATLRDVEVR